MSRTSHSASALLVNAVVHFGRGLLGGAVAPSVVAMLDQLLREHVLVPEPSVLVAFRYAMIELGLLTVMTGVL
jgi:hypothetical protein